MTIEQLEAIVKEQAARIERLERALGKLWKEEFLPGWEGMKLSPERELGPLDDMHDEQ